MRFRELVLSDASGGEGLCLAFHPRLTVVAGLPVAARRELVETLITASAGGRADRVLTSDDGPARAWVDSLVPGRPGATLVEELSRLDARLVAVDEHDARVAYHRAVARLEAVTAELAAIIDLEPTEAEDREIVAAAECIDELQDRVAKTADRAERCRRVAAWAEGLLDGTTSPTDTPPPEASSELVDLAGRWNRAKGAVERFERELSVHRADEVDPTLDRRVALLAPLDQDRLWDAHGRVDEAEARYAAALERRSELEEDLPEDLEAAIDSAHIERVRAEEVVASRWRPGILGSSVPAVTGLVLALVEASIGGLLVVVGIGVAARLIIGPRIALARASTNERRELARAGATSYLGLHLRRLSDPADPEAPQEMESITRELEEAARERTAALVGWKELVGRLEPSEADGLEAEIRAHAVRFNTALRTEADTRIQGDLDAARTDLAARRDRLAASVGDLTDRAGTLDREAETAAADLASRLAESGIDPALPATDIAVQLGRIRSDATRRGRERAALRARPDVEAEYAELIAEVADRERPGWAGTTMPPPPPAGTSLLRRRRAEVMKQVVAGQAESVDRGPDVPLVLDEPLAQLSGAALTEWLDAILDRTGQAVYLTDDPAVAAWARAHVDGDRLSLIAFGD